MSVKLRPHQQEAVAKMHNGCILYGDVGVGKTITSLGYYFERVCGGTLNKWASMTTPKDVYVITTAKVRDGKAFELQAGKMGVFADRDISTNGVKITVDSWNNLHKYVEVENAFFIFDEQRVVGYGAWSRAFIKVAKHNEWILLSATPGDTWLDYIPVFIANGWYKHKTDFLDQHVIWMPRVKFPKVLRYQNVGVLVRRRNEVLVRMPYEKHTKRHPVDVECDYDEEAFQKVVKQRWHVYENRPLRDVGELFSVMRKVVNSDKSRLASVQNLLEKHPKLIVFYNFDYELEILRTLVPPDQMASPESVEQLAAMVNRKRLDYQSGSKNSSKRREDGLSEKIGKTQEIESTSLETIDPQTSWDWLLSPEGMKANLTPTDGSSLGKTSKSSTLSSVSDLVTGKKTGFVTGSTPSGSSVGKKKRQSKDSNVDVSEVPTADGPALTVAELNIHSQTELCGFTFRGKTCRDRLPCSRHEGLSPGGIYETEETWTNDHGGLNGLKDTPTVGESSIKPKTKMAESSSSFAVAEWNGHKHEEIPATERWLYLVQYRAGAEGWNCVETDAIAFYSQTYSYRDWWQAHGRIDRINTPFTDLYYYHLISRSVIDKAIRAALKAKKSFNERNLTL